MHHASPIEFEGGLCKETMLRHMITFRPFYWLHSFMDHCIDLVVLLRWIKQEKKKNQ